MSPMMGQGGRMPIEDADELRHGSDIPAALATFVERRRPRVDWVREQSRALGELVALPPNIRNGALRESGTTAFYERYRPLTATP
jgi:2-polyprenyl-6-methoxyphenol hydroxylase-like FAD-dependent oxidoreductase